MLQEGSVLARVLDLATEDHQDILSHWMSLGGAALYDLCGPIILLLGAAGQVGKTVLVELTEQLEVQKVLFLLAELYGDRVEERLGELLELKHEQDGRQRREQVLAVLSLLRPLPALWLGFRWRYLENRYEFADVRIDGRLALLSLGLRRTQGHLTRRQHRA